MSTLKRDLFDIFTRRAAIASVGAAGAFAAIGARLIYLQADDAFGGEYTKAAEANRFDVRFVPPVRGVIYDRFGDPLALTSRDYRVSIVPEEADDLERTIQALGALVGMTPEQVERRVREARNRKPWDEVQIKQGLEWPQFAAVNVRLPEFKGVIAHVGEQRYYPYKAAFAHPIGFVQRPNQMEIEAVEQEDRKAAGLGPKAEPGEKFDSPRARYSRSPDVRVGKAGIEAALEGALHGEPGRRQVEVNATGRVVSEVGREEKVAAPGAALVLSIDAELQRFAMERMGGQSGSVVVMDVMTGDLIVMASAPGFDPNAFVNGIATPDFKALNEDEKKPLFHKTVAGAYKPGSTFKLVTALAAFQAGLDPRTRVNCPGYYWFGGRRFHCWKRGGHGEVDFRAGLKGSCNVYFYQAGLQAGQQRIADMARQLGFGRAFPLDVPGQAAGIVPDQAWWASKRNEPWPAGMTLNTAIGQGDLLVTPLQLAVMVSRLANGGRAVEPRLVRDGLGRPEPGAARLDLPADGVARTLDAMVAISNEAGGTALRSGDLGLVRHPVSGRMVDVAAAPPGSERVRMGGKTGTAQVRIITAGERATRVKKNDELDWKLRDHAWFVCFAPADKPRYAAVVLIEHGGNGSSVAAPIARDIVRATLLRDPAARPAMTLARAATLAGKKPA